MGDEGGGGDGVGRELGLFSFASGEGGDGGCFVELVEYARVSLVWVRDCDGVIRGNMTPGICACKTPDDKRDLPFIDF